MPEEESGFGFGEEERGSDSRYAWSPMDYAPFGSSADGEMSFLMHGGLQSSSAGPVPTCMYSQKVLSLKLDRT